MELLFQESPCWSGDNCPPRDDMAPQKKAPARRSDRGMSIFATEKEAEFFHRIFRCFGG
jgi:hypothetical protein